MIPRTRDEFVEALSDLIAERCHENTPFPGDWPRMFEELKGWAEMSDGHGDGECIARADHERELAEAREEGKALDVKEATAELKQERDTAVAEATAAKAELERVKRLSPITAAEVMKVAAEAADIIRREAEIIRTSKRLSKDGSTMRLGWAVEKLEKVSK